MTTNTAQRSTAHTFRRLTGSTGVVRLDQATGEHTHAAAMGDLTAEVRIDGLGGQYDPACSWCWLGYAHTQAAHAAQVTR